MNLFQILTLIISTLLLLGSIVAVYVSCRVSIAKLEIEMLSFKKDLMQKEIAICLLEKNNREDHKEILLKIDKLIEKI